MVTKTKAGKPRKKPGRKPGCEKIEGSGRKKNEWTAADVRKRILPPAVSRLLGVIEGKAMQVSGPNGKLFMSKPNSVQRLRATEICLKKCLPDLSAGSRRGKELGQQGAVFGIGNNLATPDPTSTGAQH